MTPAPPTTTPSPALETPNEGVQLSDLGWYEASRVIGPGGSETRTLYVGSLGGDLLAEIPLGALEVAQANGVAESFAWVFPQAEGIFGDAVLVWGRQDSVASIEAVSLVDGAVRSLVQLDDPVHVATADRELQRIFFITADAHSGMPTGLWANDPGDAAGPTSIEYTFADQQLSNRFKYRLAASADGSLLAIQPEEDAVTVIDIQSGASRQVNPGGPMIGFAEGGLLAYGRRTDTTRPSLLILEVSTRAERLLIDEVDAAQVVAGSQGDLVAYMQIDPVDPRSFVVGVVSLRTGERDIAYTQDPSVIGPLLARRDQAPLGSELPLDSVLLVDTFLPYIEGVGLSPREEPPESHPQLLNLLTGETLTVGPFSGGGGG